MRNILIVAQRELGAIFVQPLAYAFTVVVIAIVGLIFTGQISAVAIQPSGNIDLRNVLGLFTFLFVFAGPALTMRLLSEEQKTGTLELLMTLPVRDGDVVLGKFTAAFVFYMAATALTLIYPVILINFGNPDIGRIATSYLGVLLWGAMIISIGLLASALTENQMVAFILGLGFNLLFYLAFIPADFFNNNQLIQTILTELGSQEHLGTFFRGVLTAKDVVYFVMITAVFLFATIRVMESRRWRG